MSVPKPAPMIAIGVLQQQVLNFFQAGRYDDMESAVRQLLTRQPDDAVAWNLLAISLTMRGSLTEALTSLDRAVSLRPDFAEAYSNRGNVLRRLERQEEAVASYRCALSIKPELAEIHGNLGTALNDLGRYDEALASYERAVELNPKSSDILFNLGNTYAALGKQREAVDVYRRALQLRPDQAEIHYNLGAALTALNQLDEAAICYRRAVQLKPDFVGAYNNLGLALRELGRLSDAEASFRRALQFNPNYVEVYCNLGDVLREQGRVPDAEAAYRQAIRLGFDHPEAHQSLGSVLRVAGVLVEAELCFRRALELKPDFAEAHQSLSSARAYLSDYRRVVADSDCALELKPEMGAIWEQRLYTFSYHPDLTADAIYGEFVRWGDRFPDPAVDFSTNDRGLGRRLRVGYVSPDFRRHTSRFFFWPLFANHDHVAVELFAYANVQQEDEFTGRFKGLFDHWRDIRALPDVDVAQAIRADRIDILVDCCNHMQDDRLGVFALKPAPVQVTWLGAAWTTGLKMVDYVLFDPYLAPEGTLTRETIIRLPDFFVAYTPPEQTAEIALPPCLKNGYPTFGYSGRTERLNHRTFRVWGEILRRIPDARLILDYKPFADPPTQAHYRQFMTEHGVDVSRVVMRKSANIFEGLNDVDILLDCFPHSGGTMLFDALWMGVPALTLASRPPVGRIGTSLMTNLGLPDWVAGSEEDYVGKACAFAADPQALAQLRAGMRERMRASPVMDGVGFARKVEAAYREMWTRWVAEAAS